MSSGTTPPSTKGSLKAPSAVHRVVVIARSTPQGLLAADIPNPDHEKVRPKGGDRIEWHFTNRTGKTMNLGVGDFKTSPDYPPQAFRHPLQGGDATVLVENGGTNVLWGEILPHAELNFFNHPWITYKYNIVDGAKKVLLDPEIEIPNQA